MSAADLWDIVVAAAAVFIVVGLSYVARDMSDQLDSWEKNHEKRIKEGLKEFEERARGERRKAKGERREEK